MKTRVLLLDTSNRKLLWKAALQSALADPPAPRRRWWEVATKFLQELFG